MKRVVRGSWLTISVATDLSSFRETLSTISLAMVGASSVRCRLRGQRLRRLYRSLVGRRSVPLVSRVASRVDGEVAFGEAVRAEHPACPRRVGPYLRELAAAVELPAHGG